jgi:hypothetical protein
MQFRPSSSTKLLLALILFGLTVYLLDVFCLPYLGMTGTSIITGILIAALLFGYLMVSSREQDEREQLLRLQSDSAALYVVIAGLLAASIFYPHSEFAMAFWGVIGLAAAGRITTFLYQKYK